jgi:predicted ABC-type ATPase
VARPPAPILHILAGPNGAGKTTFYDAYLRHLTDAEFVNADHLSFTALGRHGTTRDDAELGQRLADQRRRALMAGHASIVTETTFSHPSKLDLILEAQALGYRVVVYHVSLMDADFAVARVAARVSLGGHPAPEAKIRARYQRNQPLIRQAALMADRAFVFDNTAIGQPPRRLISLAGGQARSVADELPAWAASLYAQEIAGLRA